MALRKVWTKILLKWRFLLVIAVPAIMLLTIFAILSPSPVTISGGQADLSDADFSRGQLVSLNGQCEFYWNKLLTPADFISGQGPQPDSFMKIPGVWSENAGTHYGRRGVATYRLTLSYPPTLDDPALRIRNIATAYQLYADGRMLAEVGTVSDNKTDFREGEKTLVLDLPKDTQRAELVFQVANLNYASGGLRADPIFGSKQAIERQEMILMVWQLLFIGGVFLFALYYLLLFLLQQKNKSALLFSILCFITVFRSLIWGGTPLTLLFPNASFDFRMVINYLTGYNYVPAALLFAHSLYPLEFKKRLTGVILFPTLAFDALLLITGPVFMSLFTNYIYILLLLQMLYIMVVLMKAVLRKRDNAVLMFIAICILVWTVNVDILNYKGFGGFIPYMFLFGNFAVITVMSYVQARQQATNQRKLVLYNEKLIEADKLKDQIMATEMSFLQAQIKPHFLYNALSAIANVCEKDGRQAGGLIIDLAGYLRGSLEFNSFDKMVTIEKELDFIDTYFHIEQARFGQKIQLQKDIGIPLDAQIPVLILQPLVENAVRHGISKKSGGGIVTVRMVQRDENIEIEVEDDGVGISGEKLAALFSEDDPKKSVGLRNIHNRLLKLYGSGLFISSTPGHTLVKLTIPEVMVQ